MTASLRERRRQLLRDEILHAARVLISEKGHAAMSMDELAARVGISKPTLYSHFATKEDLIVAAARQAMCRLISMIENDFPGHSPLQQLVLILRTAFQLMIEEGTTSFRPMTPELMQLIRSHPETASCIQQIDSAIHNLVQQGIQQGEIDPTLHPGTVVLAFHAIVHTIKSECLSSVSNDDPASALETLVKLFERGVRNQDTAHTQRTLGS